MKKIIAAVVAVVALAMVAISAETSPDQVAREATNKIVELLKANRDAYAKDHKKLYAMVQENILPYFDFRVMSKSVLARHWKDASEDQRTHFSNEFRDLLVRTYATALLKYTNEEIKYQPFRAKPEDKTAVVRTEVIQAGGGPNIPIHYSFYNSDSGWKVYDVAIEGVSLVTNYRSTYDTKIKREGLDALIKSMAGANKRDEPDPAAPGKAAGGK